jgi:hypothetical protein
MASDDIKKTWQKIVVKAWSDPAFKEKLLKNPKEAFKEFGVQLPAHLKNVHVYANSKDTFNFVIPNKPDREVTDKELQEMAAGGIFSGMDWSMFNPWRNV